MYNTYLEESLLDILQMLTFPHLFHHILKQLGCLLEIKNEISIQMGRAETSKQSSNQCQYLSHHLLLP